MESSNQVEPRPGLSMRRARMLPETVTGTVMAAALLRRVASRTSARKPLSNDPDASPSETS
jgi:hypothetical protein